MDTADGASDQGSDTHGGHKYPKRNSFRQNKDGNKPPEEGPLIANEAPNDEESVDNLQHSSKGKSGELFQRAWQWLVNHLMTVIIVLLLIGGIVALSVYFAVLHRSAPNTRPDTVCLTPSCVIAASEIIENMSPHYRDIDPCTDFDKYVCEGFDEKHDLRADQGSLFTGTVMAENAQQILRHVLEAPHPEVTVDATSAADGQIFEKLQDAYNACMDEELQRAVGAAPLLTVLSQIGALFPTKGQRMFYKNGVFPQLDTQKQFGITSDNDNQLSRTVTYLISIGVAGLIEIFVGADDKNPDMVVPFLNAPRRPGLPAKQYYEDPKIVTRYGQVIGQVLEALLKEASPNSTIYSKTSSFFTENAELVEGIVSFESKLAQATPDTENAEDVTFYYNPLTFEETRTLLPQLSLQHLISSFAPHAPQPSKVIVGSPPYLKTLAWALKETNAEILQAYFVWKAVQGYAYKVEDEALQPLKRFNNELQGKDPDATEERWRTCLKVADNGLGWILSKFFVEKAFSEAAKNFGDNVVSDIKAQFITKLRKADWMSGEVRDLGVEKVHAIVQKIGYPTKSPNILNASEIQEYYEKVNISSTTFFGNALSIAEFDTKRHWSALGKPTNREEWEMTADTVNAYYNPPGNEIVFPAGIMQKPVFYDPSVPQYLSYGAFGAVSGHELSHAFDSTGRHYDETGNFTDWWDKDTIEAFKKKAQCFIDQYEEFTVPHPSGDPLHVNGKLTLGENIADAGGLNAAFAAWKKVEASRQSQLLPGLQHFTKEQVFFISYSNWWCGKTRPEAAVDAIYRDPHAPTWARILGTMANSRDFRESFSCTSKETTCELW